ncbi:ABC transporter substrate-binding protein [Mycolicibacterium frederiksbergense]|uniref:ABC transporter substrate-binding protein n=1 Tax=Mycolicibacterium frederiksbergense TaxID=117567 RepID=UPI002475B342|nr:ABC transporter substrate-binding protein [Mycolicibacterium frederiksbergense]
MKVDTRDFGPAVAAVAGSGAQALMAWVTGSPATGLALEFRSSGPNIPMVAGIGAASPAFVDEVGPGADGIVVAASLVAVERDLPPSATRTVIAALTEPFERRHGAPPSQFAVDGYTAVRLITGAVDAAGDDTPEAVQQAMNSLKCLTPEGEYHFSPTDHSGLDVHDVAVTVIRDGRFRLTPWSHAQLLRHLK